MMSMMRWVAAGMLALPVAAHAQARNGNVYDGTAHQPTAAVHSEERAAGVAPSNQREQAENHDLGAINNQLLQRANQDAKAVPSSTNNVYGVQPGGVVTSTPNAGTAGAGGGGGAAR